MENTGGRRILDVDNFLQNFQEWKDFANNPLNFLKDDTCYGNGSSYSNFRFSKRDYGWKFFIKTHASLIALHEAQVKERDEESCTELGVRKEYYKSCVREFAIFSYLSEKRRGMLEAQNNELKAAEINRQSAMTEIELEDEDESFAQEEARYERSCKDHEELVKQIHESTKAENKRINELNKERQRERNLEARGFFMTNDELEEKRLNEEQEQEEIRKERSRGGWW